LRIEELAKQAFGGLLVAPALDENVENDAVLVDGTPEPMLRCSFFRPAIGARHTFLPFTDV